MLADVNKTSRRRYLVFSANVAQTPDQIKAVSEGVVGWFRSYPEDKVIQRASRKLERSKQPLRQEGEWQ